MFGDLFLDEKPNASCEEKPPISKTSDSTSNSPARERGSTGFCGLQNQGGTCYLNSLIQTLFLTPEFTENILKLEKDELLANDQSKLGVKTRVIPLQLQKVFAKLLLLEQESTSTQDLTESFGWSTAQSGQQHDVQELNRILFSAIESSLIGTSGEHLIRSLYHGTFVTQVVCQECQTISEREEDFLDLQMVVSGSGSLEQSLKFSYLDAEILSGSNQYRCGHCDKLVDAAKFSRLRALPPVLTFSLLRFTYDIKTFDRIKDTRKFTFPMLLDMSPFCTHPSENDLYELFSVVIHRGSCHGGHYHAYVRDDIGLGKWTTPEEEEIHLRPSSTGTSSDDVVSCSDPVVLLMRLLQRAGGKTSINRLCQILLKETGRTWNKRFKTQCGPIRKFLVRYSDIFAVNDGEVELVSSDYNPEMFECGNTTRQMTRNTGSPPKSSDVNGNWFDFNDHRVWCINQSDIQRQFAGKESAYMLFYRRKSTHSTAPKKVPPWLLDEVEQLNKELHHARKEYDIQQNLINVAVHFASDFAISDDGVLTRRQGLSVSDVVTVDRRKLVSEFIKEDVYKVCTRSGRVLDRCRVHSARSLPVGLHLYEDVTEKNVSLSECDSCSELEVFVWDGKQVDGYTPECGLGNEPVLLHFVHCKEGSKETSETTKAFKKCSTFIDLKKFSSDLTGIASGNLDISLITSSEGPVIKNKKLLSNAEQNESTIKDLLLSNGSRLFIKKDILRESETQVGPSQSNFNSSTSHLTLVVENRCLGDVFSKVPESSSFPVMSVEFENCKTVFELKRKIVSTINVDLSESECILRYDDTPLGCGRPVYEHELVEEACISDGQRLLLEPGTPLQPDQLALRFYVMATGHPRTEREFIANKTNTVKQCVQGLIKTTELQGEWRLCRTNWYGELAGELDDEDASLEEENIKSGDAVVLAEGKLLPKGFIRLSLRLSPENEDSSDGLHRESQFSGSLGDVEISQDSTLLQLKEEIMRLTQSMNIPSPHHLRVQEVIHGVPGRVLRMPGHTLRYHKLKTSSELSVQILKEEEHLSPSAILLNLRRRVPSTRTYSRSTQVIFDPKERATPQALRQYIGSRLALNPDNIRFAKYLRQKHEWLELSKPLKKDSCLEADGEKYKRKTKEVNLRHSPFHLQDGDIIGIKEIGQFGDDNNDFSTAEDDDARNRLRHIEEENLKRQRERRSGRSRRQEEVLRIHVDDFS
ncbi:ubiquitin carboxyl-terminal hydrolase 40 isoform X3 [Nematostella vectensis]|uniref:ubiquitin carboxyl-terminal hydrolase 40 isoform X3 n=1 Tax=Nematostella vectensis TaxID=45351 RepID=UPI002076DE6A|nr:ubiquitin carboxyl-terminal hydrolase 40 isoform X3 [Nematostella vectensis]